MQNDRTVQPEFDEEVISSFGCHFLLSDVIERVITRYIPQILQRNQKENVCVSTILEDLLDEGSKQCFVLFLDDGESWHDAWLLASSMQRLLLRYVRSWLFRHALLSHEPLQVVDIIISSLLIAETPVPRKVARLHLICDILHNSAAPLPMAWKFRQEFQSRLGLVFDHLSTIYHSFPGRITAETFKKQILSVVEIWEDWIVFSPDYTLELRSRLDGTIAEDEKSENEADSIEVQESATDYSSRFKASSFKPADPSGEQAGEGQGSGDRSDIDGEPVDDIDGEPVDDVDGEPIEDVDGEPMHLDDDLDGEPLVVGDEDVDGEPMDEDIDGVPVP
jgi:CID domain